MGRRSGSRNVASDQQLMALTTKPPVCTRGSVGVCSTVATVKQHKAMLQHIGEDGFDKSQFTLQPDGTFRISIRGMAAMAGVDQGGLTRGLKSADDENALPVSRSLVAQGFNPDDVSTWGATGGIPEDAAPFILEHYGITASSPSDQARAVLLAFSRVGINAYLKERLGVLPEPNVQPQAKSLPGPGLGPVKECVEVLQMLDVLDDRSKSLLRDFALNATAQVYGGSVLQLPGSSLDDKLTLSAYLSEIDCPPHKATPLATKIGRQVKGTYRDDHDGKEPESVKKLVNGDNRPVALYPRAWLEEFADDFRQHIKDFLAKS